MGSEKNFENRVKYFLAQNGAWYVKYWGGGDFTTAGVPDLLVCLNGFFIGVEIKADEGKPTRLQIRTLKMIDHAGGIAVLLYPDQFEVFKNLILCAKTVDQNMWFNYDILKHRVDEWERRLNDE